jgi:hypothetical protein
MDEWRMAFCFRLIPAAAAVLLIAVKEPGLCGMATHVQTRRATGIETEIVTSRHYAILLQICGKAVVICE